MRVTIVIANWNGASLLPGCLDALRDQQRQPEAIIVVDNASTDDSRALLAARYPEVRVLALPRNRGLAGGTNVGIRASDGEVVVALNNDTIPAPGWLAALIAPLEADPTLGATMSTMVFAHAPDLIASAGIAVYRNGLALEHLLGTRRDALHPEPRPVFGASAGAAAYRRAMLDDIGLFDPDFFMYLEDVDLAWRARLRGWATLQVPAAEVAHIYSASSGQGSSFKSFYLARNRLWSLRKNLPRALLQRHWPAIAGYDLAAATHAALIRDWASLRGRRAGLGNARISQQRAAIQARRTATIADLEGWLQPSPSPLAMLRLKRRVDRLSSPKSPDEMQRPQP